MKKMNLIVICADTFRRDFLGCYGNDRIHTPHLDNFSREAVQFTQAYAEALPTIEARRVYFAGKSLLPPPAPSTLKDIGPGHLGWEPIENNLSTLAECLRDQGYNTALVADTLHMQTPGMNFHRGFQHWTFIRGQESDPWQTFPKGEIRASDHIPEHLYWPKYESKMGQYIANTRHWRSEEDTFCAQVSRHTVEYVQHLATYDEPFFLWADMFDPHEPFDPPLTCVKQYWNKEIPTPDRYLFGYGVKIEAIREDDLPLIKAMYSAEVTLVDRWIGHLLETIKRLGLYENSVIVFTSDHGTSFHEHGFTMKRASGMYHTLTGLPLLIHLPDPQYHGKVVYQLVSAVDFMPGWLSLLTVKSPPEQCTGRDFTPLLNGSDEKIREYCISGYNQNGAIRNLDWLYMFPTTTIEKPGRGFDGSAGKERLFDLNNDPEEQNNVKEQHPEICRKMREIARTVWSDIDL